MNGEKLLNALRLIPVHTWNYVEEGSSIRHMGPFAEDFHLAFGLGTDNRTIGLQDIDGVNLAAIKALDERSAKTSDAVARLETENSRLRKELEEMKKTLAELARKR